MFALGSLELFIKTREGFCERAYRCPNGHLTVGYGHNLESNVISKETASVILAEDVRKVVSRLESDKLKHIRRLPENWQFVCADMLFNIGSASFLGMRRLNEALEKHAFDKALAELVDSSWFTQVGDRSKLLWLIAYKDIVFGLDLARDSSDKIRKVFNKHFAEWFTKTYPNRDSDASPVPRRVKDTYTWAIG